MTEKRDQQPLWTGRCGLTVDGANFSLSLVTVERNKVRISIPFLLLPLAAILGVRRNHTLGWILDPTGLTVRIEPGVVSRSITMRYCDPRIPDEYLVFPNPSRIASLWNALGESGAAIQT